MFTTINRIRQERSSARRKGNAEASRQSDLPLDHQLTFQPTKDERWTFEEGHRLCLNGEDLQEVVMEALNDVGLLCGVLHGIHEYQQRVWSCGGKGNAAFNGRVNSLQHTIVGRLGHIYDGLTSGVHVEADGEDFWLNNINIRSVLKLYTLRPTEAARRYIEGLQEKLGLILARRRSSSGCDAVNDQAEQLYSEISMVLRCVTPPGPPRLCA